MKLQTYGHQAVTWIEGIFIFCFLQVSSVMADVQNWDCAAVSKWLEDSGLGLVAQTFNGEYTAV